MAKRKIEVGSQLIYHTIVSQAGSFDKALLEFVMNSVDAHATEMTIEMDRHGFRVEDNGKGIQRIHDVETCLGTLGFDHDDTEGRVFGKFGAGRAQAWAFAPTCMRTGTYQMDVDIKKFGLEYELLEDRDPVDGFQVSGTFYDPMTLSDVERTERSLADMALYVSLPITFNGRRLNRPPEDQKWTLETDDACIRLDHSSTLDVYNLGVLVCRYNSRDFGSGGVVLSKRALDVNLARNAVLESKCEVWKRIKKDLGKAVGAKPKKATRLNDFEREYFLTQILSGDLSLMDPEIGKLRLLQDITGKRHRIDRVLNLTDVTFISNHEDERLAVRAHERGDVFVLSQSMVFMLGVRLPSCDTVLESLNALCRNEHSVHLESLGYAPFRGNVHPFEDYRALFESGHDLLDRKKDLTKIERCALKAIERHARFLPSLFSMVIGESREKRDIHIGVSQTAEAWTDGRTYIAIEREFLQDMRRGFPGVLKIANLLAHEYVHDVSDTTGHSHSPEFFEQYHEITQNPRFGGIAQDILAAYHSELKRAGLKPTKAMNDALEFDQSCIERSHEAA
ncbi:ATP-binding protein [Thioalkalivibrio sp. ALE16]|uniref:ATP-binding protein n=1 Tax=Thioalkalivibrio sp. ALE16 TaxID=1158172 RepID=UPI000368C630|nr:ATP-binding protein [Thioalkalivibrio sp. ALE16]